MSRRRKKRRAERKSTQRDRKSITKRELLRREFIIRDARKRSLPIGQDRRYYLPVTDDYARLEDGRRADYVLRKPRARRRRSRQALRDSTRWWIGFKRPWRVPICKRRRARRISLFALRKIGKGLGGYKKRRMTEWSKVRC